MRYATTPGPAATAPAAWPGDAPFPKASIGSTLMVFLHPQCGCSRATLEELSRLQACCSRQMEATVLMNAPSTVPAGWTDSDLRKAAVAIPGVRVLDDPDGATARRFGVHTSGQTLLYDPQGGLVFQGGITPMRGHSGDNAGRDEISHLLRGGPPRPVRTPVFGCALFEEPK